MDKGTKQPNDALIHDEQVDLVAACWVLTMTAAHAPSATKAKQRCETAWMTRPSASARQTLSVQAKLDNNNS